MAERQAHDGADGAAKRAPVGARALLAAALALVTLELGLRAVGPRVWHAPLIGQWEFVERDPFLGWRNRPGYAGYGVRIASTGLRGPELPRAKPAGERRIVCLGDSGTFGIALGGGPQGYSVANYPEELARLLAARGRRDVAVLNAGVIGYSAAHGLRQLQAQLLAYAPDVVIARFGFNDHSPAWRPSLRVREPRSSLARAALYTAARTGLGRLALHFVRSSDALHPPVNSVPWVELEEFERTLRRLAAVAEQAGFRLLLVDYPLRDDGAGAQEPLTPQLLQLLGVASARDLHALHDAYQQRQLAVARELGVPVVETRAACARAPRECFDERDMVHPARRGQRRIARALAGELARQGWLGAPPVAQP